MPMRAKDTNNANSIIYPKLSYLVTGVCFRVHNNLGRYGREKQYGNAIAKELAETETPFKREVSIGDSRNIIDFVIDDRIALEIKAKPFILKEDYFQIQRYLQSSRLKLGLLVNFQARHIKPIRVVRIDTAAKNRFSSEPNDE